jgi:hypothetical protein
VTTEAAHTAALLRTARQALEQYHDVHVDDDGALTFRHAGLGCAVQAIQLAEGLNVLSLTCVVAWDLPDDTSTALAALEHGGDVQFGTLRARRTSTGVDVTLGYTFPADGLDPVALGTLFMLVVSGASQLRADLVAG